LTAYSKADVSTARGIVFQLCPRCRIGRIFRKSIYWGFPAMNEHCPHCGLRFEREQGYFLGAMYISYGLALPMIAFFAVLLWWLAKLALLKAIWWGLIVFIPFAPMLSFLARVLWIYLDQAIDPARD
jgi:uncharacterized protein (DUF983 family)